jgi:hypothetical protein
MDSVLRNTLADCIADMERGAGVEDCLKRNSSQAAQLRPHLETWAAMGSLPSIQPPAAAFDRGRAAMLGALKPTATGFGPLSVTRFAPAWATVAAVVAAVILLGGAAGTSAALGGPDPAGRVLSAVGVMTGVATEDAESGIGHSSASERGLECASPNAFEGKANSEDRSQNAVEAHEKQSCDAGPEEDANAAVHDGCVDDNRGHGNDADHDDEDNPGLGERDHGADGDVPAEECTVVDGDTGVDGEEDENMGHGNNADHDDEDNPGQGEGNHGTDNNGNGEANSGGNGNEGNPTANGNEGNPPGNGNGGN